MSDGRISKGGCIAAIVVSVMSVCVILLWTCTTKVTADHIGVRTQMSSTGVEPRDFQAGYVLAIPGLHTVRLWDPTWTNLTQVLHVRGSDQYTTQVDVSIIFRIMPEKCHEVAQKFRDEDHVEQVAKNALNKFANEILAQMSTENFYNTKVRDQTTGEAQKAMDDQLRPFGIEVRYVLLRNIIYDPKFEAQLLQKQLAGQRKSLEISKSLLAGAETETQLIKRNAEAKVKQIDESKKQEIENLIADTDRKISNIMQDAKLEAATMIAKAESTKRQKIAQAELLKASASATGTEAMSKVYARPGASYYFARKALEGMKLGDIELNSNVFNPLDIERLMKAVGLDLHAPASPSQPKP
jgi:regulator of protease activity HflC (stomatin/prohibitin superfamily)